MAFFQISSTWSSDLLWSNGRCRCSVKSSALNLSWSISFVSGGPEWKTACWTQRKSRAQHEVHAWRALHNEHEIMTWQIYLTGQKNFQPKRSFLRLQNSRIFCERGRPSICERKAVWSECENGVRGSRASQARIELMALRAFRKRPKTTVLQSSLF